MLLVAVLSACGDGAGVDTDPMNVVQTMLPYAEAHLSEGGRLHQITRHMLGLFSGRAGARLWRPRLSEGAHTEGAGVDVLLDALQAVRPKAA